jgi:hypothetical protein
VTLEVMSVCAFMLIEAKRAMAIESTNFFISFRLLKLSINVSLDSI